MVVAIVSAKSGPSGPNTLLLFCRICFTTASRWGLDSCVYSLHFIVVAFAGAGTPDAVVEVVGVVAVVDVVGVVLCVVVVRGVVVVVFVVVVVVVVVVGPPGSVLIATEPPVVFSHAARPRQAAAAAASAAPRSPLL